MFRKSPSVRVLVGEVTSVDPKQRSVTLANGSTFSGEVLVLAAGAEVNFFGTPGASEYAYPLYSIDDANRLAAALTAELDRLDADAATSGPISPTNVVVVGGGPTGVETAGAIADSLVEISKRYYDGDLGDRLAVHLVDMGPAVLGAFEKPLQDYTAERLAKLGVHLNLNTGVKEIRADSVTLSDGSTMPADVVIWAGGLKAQSVIASAGLKTGRGGRIDVNLDLTVPDAPGVYAIGDAANIPDGEGGKTLPQLGSVALQAGKWAGDNIVADFKGKPRTAFDYFDKGFMAMIGRMAAVAEAGPTHIQMHGPMAFGAWLGVHDVLLPSGRERRHALTNWYRDYLTGKRTEFVVGYSPRDK